MKHLTMCAPILLNIIAQKVRIYEKLKLYLEQNKKRNKNQIKKQNI